MGRASSIVWGGWKTRADPGGEILLGLFVIPPSRVRRVPPHERTTQPIFLRPDCDIRGESSAPPTRESVREPNERLDQAVSQDRHQANQDHEANRGQEIDRQEEMHRPAKQVLLARRSLGM